MGFKLISCVVVFLVLTFATGIQGLPGGPQDNGPAPPDPQCGGPAPNCITKPSASPSLTPSPSISRSSTKSVTSSVSASLLIPSSRAPNASDSSSTTISTTTTTSPTTSPSSTISTTPQPSPSSQIIQLSNTSFDCASPSIVCVYSNLSIANNNTLVLSPEYNTLIISGSVTLTNSSYVYLYPGQQFITTECSTLSGYFFFQTNVTSGTLHLFQFPNCTLGQFSDVIIATPGNTGCRPNVTPNYGNGGLSVLIQPVTDCGIQQEEEEKKTRTIIISVVTIVGGLLIIGLLLTAVAIAITIYWKTRHAGSESTL